MESCQGTVPEAVTAFLEGTDFEDVIRTAVSLGGNCDTLTCIAGSIAEAFYGVPSALKRACEERLPEDMREVLHRFNARRTQIAVRDDWKTLPMPEEHETFVLHRAITEAEFRRLRLGHIPEEMEDKWFWYLEANRLYLHRSWTGYSIFIREIHVGEKEQTVLANRDPNQVRDTSVQEDTAVLNALLDRWTRPAGSQEEGE